MPQVLSQETNIYASPITGRVTYTSPTSLAWFIRVCGLLVLAAAIPRTMHEGWSEGVLTCGCLAGVFHAGWLFVMSFLYVTFGRTKLLIAGATLVLGLSAIVFSAAMLILPH